MNQKPAEDISFGEWLRQRRHLLDLTQQELADQVGCAREILRLLANGRSNADIATQLFLSEDMVRNYVSGIFSKLGVTDRTQAAVIALRHGLVD